MTRFSMIQQHARSNPKAKRTMPIFAIIILVFMVAGCESAGTKQIIGTGAGAAIGGYAGSLIGKDEGRLAATAGGALLGAWLGSEIGKSLDKADQLYQAQATQDALDHNKSGQATTWTNPDSHHSGSVTPVKTVQADGKVCREFTQTVMIEGKEETVTGKACRDQQGWVLQ